MTMWKASFILALVLFSGCRSKESPMAVSDDALVVLVRDATSILLGVYPPARTRLHLVRDADDAFGSVLTAAMRESGYAIGEYVKPAKGGKTMPPQDSMPFDYRLVETNQDKQLRLVLHVGGESLSRLYVVQETADALTLAPDSYWVRKQ